MWFIITYIIVVLINSILLKSEFKDNEFAFDISLDWTMIFLILLPIANIGMLFILLISKILRVIKKIKLKSPS
jgi:hypothetical protein